MIPTAYAATTNAFDLGENYGLGYIKTVGEGFSHLIRPSFEIAGAALIIYLVVAGFKWIASGGDKEAIASARAMITHAIIGFALLILFFLVLKFLPEYLELGIKFIP
jgi:hypothetical protein